MPTRPAGRRWRWHPRSGTAGSARCLPRALKLFCKREGHSPDRNRSHSGNSRWTCAWPLALVEYEKPGDTVVATRRRGARRKRRLRALTISPEVVGPDLRHGELRPKTAQAPMPGPRRGSALGLPRRKQSMAATRGRRICNGWKSGTALGLARFVTVAHIHSRNHSRTRSHNHPPHSGWPGSAAASWAARSRWWPAPAERRLGASSRRDHHHHLPGLRCQHPGLGGQQQRRGIKDDDPVGIAPGHVVQQVAHRIAGQQFGRAR